MSVYLKTLSIFLINSVVFGFSTYAQTGTNLSGSKLSPERWATNQGRFWTEQHWLAGDFNGDGAEDVARAFNDVRKVSIDVYRSDKTKFTRENWVAQQGRFWTEQRWLVGDFNGDGADDIARIFKDGRDVSIDVYCSSKQGFVLKNWVQQKGRFWTEQHWRAGDFDGDGAEDIARMFNDVRNVSIDVYRSNKQNFTLESWTTQKGRFWTEQHMRAGDFNGDGVDDLARIFKDGRNVSIDVYRSDKQSFVMENWAQQQGRFWTDQHWFAGDFDGDGIEEIARVYNDNRTASFDLYRSNKKGFVFSNWAQQQGRFWVEQEWRAGDFNGDGSDDIVKVFKDGRDVSIDTHLSTN